MVALLAEGVDRNIGAAGLADVHALSPSSRRAWIEMILNFRRTLAWLVALLAEGVDRNTRKDFKCPCGCVALLAEGVDRNNADGFVLGGIYVALLAEGVDRNMFWRSQATKRQSRPPRGGRG